MALYIITVEWRQGEISDKSSLDTLISSSFKNQKLTNVSYLVESSNTAVDIRNFVVNSIPSVDRVFVGEMATSAAWRNMQSSSTDIKLMYENE